MLLVSCFTYLTNVNIVKQASCCYIQITSNNHQDSHQNLCDSSLEWCWWWFQKKRWVGLTEAVFQCSHCVPLNWHQLCPETRQCTLCEIIVRNMISSSWYWWLSTFVDFSPLLDMVLIPSTHMAMVGWRPKECHEQTLGKRSSIWSGWSPGWAKKEGDDKMTMLSASIYFSVITSQDQVDTFCDFFDTFLWLFTKIYQFATI